MRIRVGPDQKAHSLEQQMDTLESGQLTEESKAISRTFAWVIDGSRLVERAAVLLKHDAVRRDAPVDVALTQKPAGRDEQVDQPQHCLREALAHEECLR